MLNAKTQRIECAHGRFPARAWPANAHIHVLHPKLECGTAWVNQHLQIMPNVPFGGAKWSGIGVENGHWGLYGFTETRVINIAKK